MDGFAYGRYYATAGPVIHIINTVNKSLAFTGFVVGGRPNM